VTDDDHELDRDDDREHDAFEARLREALHARADEAGQPAADASALARRRRAREVARRRRAAGLAAVAAVLALVGASLAWASAHRGDDGDVAARTSREPERHAAGPGCPLPPGAPDSIVGLDRPGTGPFQTTLVDTTELDPAVQLRMAANASAVTVYTDPSARDLVGVAIEIAPARMLPIEPGPQATLTDGQVVTVVTDPGGSRVVAWPRGATTVQVTTVGLDEDETLAVAARVQREVTVDEVAPVRLDPAPRDLPLLASGLTALERTWMISWGDGEAFAAYVTTDEDSEGRWADTVAGTFRIAGARWVEVAGVPGILTPPAPAPAEDGFALAWRREDDTSVKLSSTVEMARWEDVVVDLCGIPIDGWPALEAWAQEHGSEWRPPVAGPAPPSTPGSAPGTPGG